MINFESQIIIFEIFMEKIEISLVFTLKNGVIESASPVKVFGTQPIQICILLNYYENTLYTSKTPQKALSRAFYVPLVKMPN